MRKLAAIVVGGLACAALSPATAAADVTPFYDSVVYTTNDSAVASVERWAGWELEVCDQKADGIHP